MKYEVQFPVRMNLLLFLVSHRSAVAALGKAYGVANFSLSLVEFPKVS